MSKESYTPLVSYSHVQFRNFRPGARWALFGGLFWENETGETHLKVHQKLPDSDSLTCGVIHLELVGTSLIFSVSFQQIVSESRPSWGFPVSNGVAEATLHWIR